MVTDALLLVGERLGRSCGAAGGIAAAGTVAARWWRRSPARPGRSGRPMTADRRRGRAEVDVVAVARRGEPRPARSRDGRRRPDTAPARPTAARVIVAVAKVATTQAATIPMRLSTTPFSPLGSCHAPKEGLRTSQPKRSRPWRSYRLCHDVHPDRRGRSADSGTAHQGTCGTRSRRGRQTHDSRLSPRSISALMSSCRPGSPDLTAQRSSR
jgi:hypothetical protein